MIRSASVLDREFIAANRDVSAHDLVTDLERWQRGEAITARADGKVKGINKWIRTNKAITALALSMYRALCFDIIMSIKARGDVPITRVRPEAWRGWVNFL
jgi:hypothetical protein